MPKEWVLNSANMRWGLNKKKQVGAVAEEIRKCSPRSIIEWEDYYYKNVYPKSHLVELGKKLYIKISEVIRAEIDEISEEDCINFVINLVINRTYDGYTSEKETVYGQLQDILGVKIEPAPDEWDRGYNVDFFIKINEKYVGLQIKPTGYEYIPQIINERTQQKETHDKFAKKYGGKVFYIFSVKDENTGRKIIANKEVIDEIKSEITRLSQ
ncbi:MjaI family restriction endonuclease [Candidatus Micrarchaeota archaeon]|nr:MjaI family restriction endonuclease [Candidatus Micrarchaeota archaeon]